MFHETLQQGCTRSVGAPRKQRHRLRALKREGGKLESLAFQKISFTLILRLLSGRKNTHKLNKTKIWII